MGSSLCPPCQYDLLRSGLVYCGGKRESIPERGAHPSPCSWSAPSSRGPRVHPSPAFGSSACLLPRGSQSDRSVFGDVALARACGSRLQVQARQALLRAVPRLTLASLRQFPADVQQAATQLRGVSSRFCGSAVWAVLGWLLFCWPCLGCQVIPELTGAGHSEMILLLVG